ncbi:uncharacterized protein LOC144085803 [Stigmatopora argus]
MARRSSRAEGGDPLGNEAEGGDSVGDGDDNKAEGGDPFSDGNNETEGGDPLSVTKAEGKDALGGDSDGDHPSCFPVEAASQHATVLGESFRHFAAAHQHGGQETIQGAATCDSAVASAETLQGARRLATA